MSPEWPWQHAGRALPIATGVRLSRPELPVIVIMGDGDCFSIGGNHWLHAIRYNIDALVLVLDNEVYALTKMQASPTTPDGWKTNTTPKTCANASTSNCQKPRS